MFIISFRNQAFYRAEQTQQQTMTRSRQVSINLANNQEWDQLINFSCIHPTKYILTLVDPKPYLDTLITQFGDKCL